MRVYVSALENREFQNKIQNKFIFIRDDSRKKTIIRNYKIERL